MKLYYSIKEVAEMLNVNASLLRYWESEFSQLRPRKTAGGSRAYTEKDIALLREIYRLTKECGFTLEGARQQLKKGHHAEPSNDVQTPSPTTEPAAAKTIDPNTQTSLFDTDPAENTAAIRQLEEKLQESQRHNRQLQDQIASHQATRTQAIESLRQARQQLEDLRQSLHQE